MPRAREVRNEDGELVMMKVCSTCGEDKLTCEYTRRIQTFDKLKSNCLTCDLARYRKGRDKVRQANDWDTHVRWKYSTASRNAKKKGIAICSLEEWMTIFWEQFAATNGCCPEMGIEYNLTNNLDGSTNPKAPSPDQMVPSTGYVRGNIRWVCSFFNKLKCDHSLDTVNILLESYMYRRGVIEEGEIPLPEKPIYYPPT